MLYTLYPSTNTIYIKKIHKIEIIRVYQIICLMYFIHSAKHLAFNEVLYFIEYVNI